MSEQSVPYKDIILRNGLDLREDQLVRLDEYCSLLLQWNTRLNLVSRKDEDNVWPNHILHSLAVLIEVDIPDGVRVADIGTGGGLPGIPLSIAKPHATFVLIESVRKKCVALEAMVQSLGLGNVEVVNARAEDILIQKKYKRSFDVIVARAVAPLGELINWSAPLGRRSAGTGIAFRRPELREKAIRPPALIAMKGGDLKREITEARKASQPRSIQSFPIDFDGIDQTSLADKQIVVVEL